MGFGEGEGEEKRRTPRQVKGEVRVRRHDGWDEGMDEGMDDKF